jgi:molybdate transport system ATP-binding protein
MRPMTGADPHYLEVRLARASLRRGGRTVLRAVSWVIRPGERWVLAGGNGAGKTQLLKLVAGSVWPVLREPPPLRYRLGKEEATTPFGLKEEIAYLGAERQDQYQRYGWNSPAARVVGTGIEHSDIPLEPLTRAQRRRVRAVLAALEATQLAPRPFLSLSYGERRVVLLARALVSRPRLLLLDEVLNGLDASNRERILRWLARARRLPWVLATHRLADVPRGATHALVLHRGRAVYAGPVRGAPLARWLAVRGDLPAEGGRRRLRRGRARQLVRLNRARVYLEQRRALAGVSLTVRAGEVWVVHGHNGSGKTTLLRTLYGDCGVAAGGSIERARAAAGVPLECFRRRVGLVAPHLQAEHPRELSVTEVVQSGRHASIGLNGAPSAADRAAAQRALASFGLTRLAARHFGELSYGQSRRVLFARAWASEPELLLLEEPFAGIDAPTRHSLAQRVLALSARATAVVLATHRPDEWRASATHELELAAGRARYCGPVRAARAPARSRRNRAR